MAFQTHKNLFSSKPAISIFLFIGVGSISSAATLIRLAHVPPLTIATYRMLFSAILLWFYVVPFMKITCRQIEWKLIIGAGLSLAVHFAFWISSLETTSVASSLVLVTMNPILVAIGSVLFLHEKPGRILLVSTIISIIGCALLLIGEAFENVKSIQGNLLALGGAAAMSSYLLLGRKLKADIPFFIYITYVYSVSALFLLVSSILLKNDLLSVPEGAWKYLIALAIVPQLIGHSSINWTLRHVHASYTALVILLEPFLGTLLAYWILGEGFSKWTVIGGIVISLSVIAVFLRGSTE